MSEGSKERARNWRIKFAKDHEGKTLDKEKLEQLLDDAIAAEFDAVAREARLDEFNWWENLRSTLTKGASPELKIKAHRSELEAKP